MLLWLSRTSLALLRCTLPAAVHSPWSSSRILWPTIYKSIPVTTSVDVPIQQTQPLPGVRPIMTNPAQFIANPICDVCSGDNTRVPIIRCVGPPGCNGLAHAVDCSIHYRGKWMCNPCCYGASISLVETNSDEPVLRHNAHPRNPMCKSCAGTNLSIKQVNSDKAGARLKNVCDVRHFVNDYQVHW